MGKTNKQILCIFLIINSLLWSYLQLLRNIISIDSMEAITWGELFSFGTNKHPPLSGWLIAPIYNFLGHNSFLVYLLGQLCLVVGFIYVYKLAKFFLSEEKSVCSSLILISCFYYTFYIFVNSYNCNVLLMGLVPVVTYYFYKSIRDEKTKDWIIFGTVSALAFLGKYQIVFLFVAMFLYLLLFERKQFKKKNLYLALLVGITIISPHIMWLMKTNFFSFSYMIERTTSETHNLAPFFVMFRHIFYPIKFIIDQLLAIIPCALVYFLMTLQTKNVKFRNPNIDKKNSYFLLIIGIAPILIHSIMGVITGNRVPGIWGSIMISNIGILLFYFFPLEFNKSTFKCFVKALYGVLGISAISVLVFALCQTKYFIAYPYQKIIPDFNSTWDKRTNNAPLKYVAGSMQLVFPLRFYNERRPKIILESFGHKSPFENHKDILRSGAIILGETEEDLDYRTKDAIYLLPEDFQIITEEYNYKVCNKFNKCREKMFYYTIIPPQNLR